MPDGTPDGRPFVDRLSTVKNLPGQNPFSVLEPFGTFGFFTMPAGFLLTADVVRHGATVVGVHRLLNDAIVSKVQTHPSAGSAMWIGRQEPKTPIFNSTFFGYKPNVHSGPESNAFHNLHRLKKEPEYEVSDGTVMIADAQPEGILVEDRPWHAGGLSTFRKVARWYPADEIAGVSIVAAAGTILEKYVRVSNDDRARFKSFLAENLVGLPV